MTSGRCVASAMVTNNSRQANLFVLHRRPYQEEAALVDCFSRHDGRIRLVARGMRRKRNPLAPLLQPFIPLHGEWHLRGELGKLTSLESDPPCNLAGDALYAGFYLNELLLRVLPLNAATVQLFDEYLLALTRLKQGLTEPTLRQFEQALLYEVGEGSAAEVFRCSDVYAEQHYAYQHGQGLIPCEQNSRYSIIALGWQFAAIVKNQFSEPEVLKLAKRLNRVRLAPLLGSSPLKSRELWKEMRSSK